MTIIVRKRKPLKQQTNTIARVVIFENCLILVGFCDKDENKSKLVCVVGKCCLCGVLLNVDCT